MYTNRLLSHVLAVVLPIAAAPVLAGPAHADHSSESRSAAQFLSGSVLGSDQSTVVAIDGTSTEYRDGHTAGPSDHETADLDVTALSALTIPLPNEITVGDLLQLGVVTQESEALPAGDSWATTGTADATLDLMALLPPNGVLQTASLHFGALGAYAEIDGATGELTRTTTIADLELALRSQLIADLTAAVNQVVSGLTIQVDALQTLLATSLEDSVDAVLGLVSVTGTVVPDPTTVALDTSRLDDAITGVLDRTICTGLTCIDLTTGVITVDLDGQPGGINLNELAPNTRLTDVLTQVAGDVAALLAQVQADLDEIMSNALGHVDVTLHAGAQVTAPVVGTDIGGVDVDYSGSLGALLDGTAALGLTTNGSVGDLLDPLLTTATSIVRQGIVTTVDTALGTAVTDAGQAVDTLVNQLANTLDPVLDALARVVDITLNEQNVADGMTSRATVTAVAIDVLTGPLAGITLDVATSAVGPNTFLPVTPTTDPPDEPVVATPGPTDGSSTPDTTPTPEGTVPDSAETLDGGSTTDGVLPATGSPFGSAALALLALLGMGMVAGGTALTRRHRG